LGAAMQSHHEGWHARQAFRGVGEQAKVAGVGAEVWDLAKPF